MIVGIGIDTVSIERISQKIERPEFLEKVFSKEEIEYCQQNAKPAEHFAARFGAKEAFLKAVGKGLGISYELKDIEIYHHEDGAPKINLYGEFKKFNSEFNRIHVSLSHTESVATAIVILEK